MLLLCKIRDRASWAVLRLSSQLWGKDGVRTAVLEELLDGGGDGADAGVRGRHRILPFHALRGAFCRPDTGHLCSQLGGSRYVSFPASQCETVFWIRIQSGQWIRIRNPDPGGPAKIVKSEVNCNFWSTFFSNCWSSKLWIRILKCWIQIETQWIQIRNTSVKWMSLRFFPGASHG